MSTTETAALMVHGGAGTMAMATMPDEEFDQRLAFLQKGQERIRRIKRELMVEGTHYGTIPGTDKPTLLKPGAEVLCSIYGLRADFVPRVEYGHGEAAPAVRVSMRCELHLGDLAGPVVAVGYGAANSWERKHRYRRGERSCPECATLGSVRRSTFENKAGQYQGQKGWWCRDCRTNWDDPKEPAILEQQTGDIENPDQHDLENTLVKMAKKRAHIDAALTGTASSDLFTQDLDEQEHHDPPKPPPPAQAKPAQPEYPNEPEAYDRHGVEPPPTRHTEGQRPVSEAAGQKPACPGCGSNKRVNLSKFPKKGAFYCGACQAPFGPTS